ncbi:MAG: secretin N-terminal domain-containing protein [Pseudomonadota bacterium]
MRSRTNRLWLAAPTLALALAVSACSNSSIVSNLTARDVNANTTVNPIFANSKKGPQGFIRTDRINEGPQQRRARRQANDYETSITDDIVRGGASIMETASGRPGFNPNQQVSLNFDNEPLRNVLQRILGGILQVNYVADPGIQGAVTLRTERPIPLSQVIRVLQDILARNGLAIRLINGVYQVGTASQLDVLEANARSGKLGQDTTRVVRLTRGRAATLAEAIAPVLQSGITAHPYEDTNALILEGNPDDFPAVERLIKTLVDTGIAEQRVAVLQLRESPPDQVARRITELYASLGRAPVTVIPLAERQAVMVASPSRAAINDVRRLVREIDIDLRDSVSLRVLQLTHLQAAEVASQLSSVFGGQPPAPDAQAAATGNNRSNIIQSGVELAEAGGVDVRTGETATSVLAENEVNQNTEAAAQTAPQATARIANAAIQITPDTRNNALLIRSSFETFRRIREVVRALDVPIGQVVIEANILEVDLSDELSLGVQFFLQSNDFTLRSSRFAGGVTDPGGAGAVAIVNADFGAVTFDAVINALQAVTNVKVLSSPYVTVVNGATARLSVGDQIPFTTASQTSQSSGTVTVTQEIETRDVGVILTVTPNIRPDNSVLLTIEQEVSSARQFAGGGSEETTNPVIAQRNITSQITVDSGVTALLGGLIIDRAQDNETGVPVLRRIPIIGNAFKQNTNTQGRSELLVLITPRVVRTSHQLDQLTRQLRSFTAGVGPSAFKN